MAIMMMLLCSAYGYGCDHLLTSSCSAYDDCCDDMVTMAIVIILRVIARFFSTTSSLLLQLNSQDSTHAHAHSHRFDQIIRADAPSTCIPFHLLLHYLILSLLLFYLSLHSTQSTRTFHFFNLELVVEMMVVVVVVAVVVAVAEQQRSRRTFHFFNWAFCSSREA